MLKFIGLLFTVFTLSGCSHVETHQEENVEITEVELKNQILENMVERSVASKPCNETISTEAASGRESNSCVVVESKYKTSNKEMYMNKKAYKRFKEMFAAAKRARISLKIFSAKRSYAYQMGIWGRKWRGEGKHNKKRFKGLAGEERAKKIMRYSAVPGTSRHHWGTDIDIYSANPTDFNSDAGKRIYEWLKKNAHKFGFCQPYDDSANRGGYEEEKWHWSYKPVAGRYYNLVTSDYGQYAEKYVYVGDEEERTANGLFYVKGTKAYVTGINRDCSLRD